MPVCDGRGDKLGEHCCQVEGQDCEVLIRVDGVPRCPFMLRGEAMLGNAEWEKLPIARWFARQHPGFDCADFPQDIPYIMSSPTAGKCCWEWAD